MDLRHLRYFIAVAEEQNIGRAATRLHMSQPPLTRQIQQLEEELGVQLFVRTPRGMELTPAGELLLEEARNIRAVVEQATERTQRAGQGRLGRLDIGIFGSAILDLIPNLLREFRAAYPDVRLVLHSMNTGEQIEALLVALPEHHPLAQQALVPFAALAEQPLVLFPTGSRPSFIDRAIGLCQQAGFVPQVAQEVGDTVTAIALVSAGFGASLVSASTAAMRLPGVVYRPLAGLPENAHIDLSCIYRSDDHSPILAAFLEVVRAYRAGRHAGTARQGGPAEQERNA